MPVELGDLGEIVRHQPHASAYLRVEGEDHDRASCDPSHLSDSLLLVIVPMMDRQDRHRRIHALICEGSGEAPPRIAGGRLGSRWAIITSLGSTAMTYRSRGS